MNLRDAVQSTIEGVEDRGGVNKFDVYVSDERNSSKAAKLQDLRLVVRAFDHDNPKVWYFVSLAIQRWKLQDVVFAEEIRELLAEPAQWESSRARYYAIRAMGDASGSLLPDDVMAEMSLRAEAPCLWLDLFLLAYDGGNPRSITDEVNQLVRGRNPLVSWMDLRSKLPELRTAFGGVPEFRKQMKEIAGNIDNRNSAAELLKAVQKRVGGDLDKREVRKDSLTSRRVFEISNKFILLEKKYAQQSVTPGGEIAVLAG